MTTQVQQRGAAAVTQEARTLASREMDINTTDWRLSPHDGSTPGGVPHVNWRDAIAEEFTYAAASGTNTITMSLAKAPASWSDITRVLFKAANTNSGSATLNVNSLGAKTIKKKDPFTSSLVTLDAGDIIQDGMYAAYYNGTDIVLESTNAGGVETVFQGDLDTSTGTFSATANISTSGDVWGCSSPVTLPGGQYGFYLESRNSLLSEGSEDAGAFWAISNTTSSYVAAATAVILNNGGGFPTDTIDGQQRYINSSPPWDLGEGKGAHFIFLLLNSNGNIVAHYAADVPPWGYNGPTDIRAKHICKLTGKKYRKVMQELTIEEILSGARPKMIAQEITNEMKNADMGLIPHPFGVIPPDHKVVLMDAMCDKVARLIEYQNAGGGMDLSDALYSGKIYADNEKLSRKGPKGVMQVRLKFRKT